MKNHGVQLLYGDWNLSLLIVKRMLAAHGVHVDLCAWMPLKQENYRGEPANTRFDTCAMFLVGSTIERPDLLWGLRSPKHGGGSDGLSGGS